MAEKEVKKQKKPNFFQRLRLGTRIKNTKSEFKKITWARPKSVFKSFGVVIAVVIALAVVIGLFDFGLLQLFDLLASKINI